MKSANFSYFKASTIEEAVALKDKDENSIFLAGGQSLMPTLNMRLSAPSYLIDINDIDELKQIKIDEDAVVIGSLCTHSELLNNEDVKTHFPILPKILKHIAHPAIRNRGTHGGSIAYADPAAELPALAVLLNADITVFGSNGKRTLSANEFYIGLFETKLKIGEIIINIRYPRVKKNEFLFFDEIVRRHGDYAMAGLMGYAKFDELNISDIRLVFFATGDKPNEAPQAAKYLIKNDFEYDQIKNLLKSDIDFTSDINSKTEMKAHLSAILLEKMLKEIKNVWGNY